MLRKQPVFSSRCNYLRRAWRNIRGRQHNHLPELSTYGRLLHQQHLLHRLHPDRLSEQRWHVARSEDHDLPELHAATANRRMLHQQLLLRRLHPDQLPERWRHVARSEHDHMLELYSASSDGCMLHQQCLLFRIHTNRLRERQRRVAGGKHHDLPELHRSARYRRVL